MGQLTMPIRALFPEATPSVLWKDVEKSLKLVRNDREFYETDKIGVFFPEEVKNFFFLNSQVQGTR